MKYIVIALVSLAISGFFYFRTLPALSRGRRWLLFSLRALSLYILLLLLISPILYFLRQNVQKQQIILLRDVSASLDLKSGKQSKKDFLKPLGEQAAKKFEQAGYELLSYDFARGLEAASDNTLLMPALSELTDTHDFNRVKGIVLLSSSPAAVRPPSKCIRTLMIRWTPWNRRWSLVKRFICPRNIRPDLCCR